MSGDELNQALQKAGLFQTPGLPTEASMQERFNTMARSFRSDIAKKVKAYERLTKTEWGSVWAEDKNKAKSLLDAMMMLYRSIGTVTWTGDNIQRTLSYLIARDQNPDLSAQQLADYVANAHGAYGKMSQKYRELMSRIFFVHTFRVLMPQEVGKSMWGLPVMMTKRLLRGQQYSQSEWLRATRAMCATVFFPIAVHAMMSAFGWEPYDEGLPEWLKSLKGKIPVGLPFPTYQNHWKYRKNITTPDGESKEIIVGVNDIVNMPVKWISRLTKERPEKLNDAFYPLISLIKWELNPLYRVVIDLATNDASMGDRRPFNPADSPEKRIMDRGLYAWGNIMRIYRPVLLGITTTAQKRQAKAELNGALNGVEKVLLGYYTGYTHIGKFTPITFGYMYSQKDRRRRLGSALQSLGRAVAGEKATLKRELADRPEQYRDALRELIQMERMRRERLRGIFLGGEFE